MSGVKLWFCCGMINVVIWKLEFSLIIVSCGAETSIHQCPAWIPGPSVWQWSITSHSHHISWNVTATNIYQHQTHRDQVPAIQPRPRTRYHHDIKYEDKKEKRIIGRGVAFKLSLMMIDVKLRKHHEWFLNLMSSFDSLEINKGVIRKLCKLDSCVENEHLRSKLTCTWWTKHPGSKSYNGK